MWKQSSSKSGLCNFFLVFEIMSQGKSLEDVLQLQQEPDIKTLYPQLSMAAAIALTVPMSTAEVERLFSTMKRVSYRKITMQTVLTFS